MFWLGYVLKLAADMIKRGFRTQVSGFSPLATCVATENAVHTAGQCGGAGVSPGKASLCPLQSPHQRTGVPWTGSKTKMIAAELNATL